MEIFDAGASLLFIHGSIVGRILCCVTADLIAFKRLQKPTGKDAYMLID